MANHHPEIILGASGDSTDAESTPTTRKRPQTIFNIRNVKQKMDLFQQTIPGYIESKTMLKDDSERARTFHRSIFEKMVLDLTPFNEVNLTYIV